MYATADDMRARYGEDRLVQIVDAAAWDATAVAAVNLALADASVLADGFVSKYLAAASGIAVPPLLIRIVCEIAFAELQRAPTDDATRRRDEAMALLDKISRGLVKLDEGRGDLPARAGALIVPEAERMFSRDRLGGF